MPDNLSLKKRRHLNSFQIIILGFFGVILLGALLLMLPISTNSGIVTPFNEAAFTATSAVCVTGLVVQDTATYWSGFGQAIILILIQIGGLGVVTVTASFALLSGRNISLAQRSTMQEAIAAPKVGGIVKLTAFILKATFIFELAGALIMLPVFCSDFGVRGIWMAVFHSVSAFCNAGFDIMGTPEAPFASLTYYMAHPVINVAVILLIVIGGIGFLTWEDVYTHRLHFKKYRMQSKVIFLVTGLLILIPAIIFFFFEFSDMPINERIFASLFQSVTPRTAGFNTADLAAMSPMGQGIITVLMLIGGSPGSTAGGMKTTTVAVLFANVIAVFRRKEETQFFGRRVDNSAVRSAATILIMYITLFFSGAVAISTIEGIPFGECVFETASAVGTAGLTLGITTSLGIASQIILMILMFLGRVGGLTLIFATISGINKNLSKLPQEKITVG